MVMADLSFFLPTSSPSTMSGIHCAEGLGVPYFRGKSTRLSDQLV